MPKFLVVGHTYGPTDRCFGANEKYKIENVYTSEEWYQHVRDSSTTKVEVIEMQQENHDYRGTSDDKLVSVKYIF